MNKNELVTGVAAQVGDRRMAAVTVDAVLDTIMRSVAEGQKVALSGFGVFERLDRAARTGRNPATGSAVEVAAMSVPRFRPGQTFKGVVSGERELPDRAQPSAAPARNGAAARTPRRPSARPPSGDGAGPAAGTAAATEQPPTRTGKDSTRAETSPGKDKKGRKDAKSKKDAKAKDGKAKNEKAKNGKKTKK